jgi:hypothetical protein
MSTKAQLEKANIFDEVKKGKTQAMKALKVAKEIEAKKLKNGYEYVTSADGKTSVLKLKK